MACCRISSLFDRPPSGPSTRTEIDVTTVTDQMKTIMDWTIGIDLIMIVTDIKEINIDQAMTTTDTIMTGTIT